MNAIAEIDTASVRDLMYLRALMEIEGVGCASLSRLLNAVDSPEALWNAPDDFLRAHLPAAKCRAFIQRRERGVSLSETGQWVAQYERRGVVPVACTSAFYPPLLREISQPPPILYVQGSLDALLTERPLAVVGTRNASEYGRQVVQRLMGEIAGAQVAIISGLAAGIDTEAHRMALRLGMTTMAVFGCGLDGVYPAVNASLAAEIAAQGGALISEYPFGTPPSRKTFPRRNRIVAGMSQGVLVVEGDVKSGAMITARLALEEGRSVFAVPGSIFAPGSQGPFSLLKSGAIPVSGGSDILGDLNWEGDSATRQGTLFPDAVTNIGEGAMIKGKAGSLQHPVPRSSLPEMLEQGLSPSERLLLQALPERPILIETLQQELGWTASRFSEALTLLELEGLLVQLPGARVCRSAL